MTHGGEYESNYNVQYKELKSWAKSENLHFANITQQNCDQYTQGHTVFYFLNLLGGKKSDTNIKTQVQIFHKFFHWFWLFFCIS